MHGITTIEKINRDNAEAADIMKSKGYDLPKIERSADAPPEVHIHIPLGASPADRAALRDAAVNGIGVVIWPTAKQLS